MFMKEILIKLSQWAMDVNKENPLLRHVSCAIMICMILSVLTIC